MSSADEEHLHRLLGDAQLQWLLDRVRRRLELGQPLSGTVALADATPAQRLAVKRLLGRPPSTGGALRVSLEAVDEVVRRSGASPAGLEAAVTALTGPVIVRRDAIASERRAWERAFEPLSALVQEHLSSQHDGSRRLTASEREASSRLATWLEHIRGSGVVKRMQSDPLQAGELVERLAAVLAALPAKGEPLGAFAARVAGGAHALDDGQPLATLALGAARALAGIDAPRAEESPAESRREAWAAVGLLCDELSSTVLTLSLPGDRQTGSGGLLEAAGRNGEPIWLTLRQLVRDPPAWADATSREGADSAVGHFAGRTVYICENPVVVALAADRLGGRCAPLVCTSGQPGAAAMVLLRNLAAAGAHLVHHGDFDWGGVRIGNTLHARLPLTPWRFDSNAYLSAAASAATSATTPRLSGQAVSASWDPSLTDHMRRIGVRIEEEVVADDLLADLAPSI